MTTPTETFSANQGPCSRAGAELGAGSLATDRRFAPQLSVIIPVLDEEQNVGELLVEIRSTLEPLLSYEVIFVDDGSTDGTADAVRVLLREAPVRLIRHSVRRGQSAAIRTGVKAAGAAWIATLDGDRQNDPADLPRLWELAMADPEPGLVIGRRARRQDSLAKRFASWVANCVRGRILLDDCPDSGCGIRIFRRSTFLDLPWFDHMHRFLPALFQRNGHRVISIPVNHRPRVHGSSKYGIWDRLWAGIVDLLGVLWLERRTVPAPDITEEEEDYP